MFHIYSWYSIFLIIIVFTFMSKITILKTKQVNLNKSLNIFYKRKLWLRYTLMLYGFKLISSFQTSFLKFSMVIRDWSLYKIRHIYSTFLCVKLVPNLFWLKISQCRFANNQSHSIQGFSSIWHCYKPKFMNSDFHPYIIFIHQIDR